MRLHRRVHNKVLLDQDVSFLTSVVKTIEVDPRVPGIRDEIPFPHAKQCSPELDSQLSVQFSVQSEITALAGKTYRHIIRFQILLRLFECETFQDLWETGPRRWIRLKRRSRDFSKRGGVTLYQSEGIHQIVMSFSPHVGPLDTRVFTVPAIIILLAIALKF